MLSHEMLTRYSTSIVFFNVLASSLGFPIPSTTVLATIAASVTLVHPGWADTLAHCGVLLGAAIAGGLAGDVIWFMAGRRYGKRVQTLVSNLSSRRRNGSDRFERVFIRWGPRLLVLARFVPGLSLVAVPMCGSKAIGMRSFVIHDGISIALWAFVALIAGALFAKHIDVLLTHVSHFAWQTTVLGFTPALLLLFRFISRWMNKKVDDDLSST
jgi:membrane protein DedA with SNARE-associated domain